MKRPTAFVLLVILTLFWARPGNAGTNQEIKTLQDEVNALKGNQSTTRKDLKEIKKLLQKDTVPDEFTEATLNIRGNPVKGAENAKIVIVAFSDFQCAWSRAFVRETLPQIESTYINTGKVKYVFFDFPLSSPIREVAENAHCAGEQENFWEMHDRLFSKQSTSGPAAPIDHAEAIGLDIPRFRECVERHTYSARISDGFRRVRQLGVNGVPTFFIGLAEPEDNVRVLKVLHGFKGGNYEAFKEAITELFSSQKN